MESCERSLGEQDMMSVVESVVKSAAQPIVLLDNQSRPGETPPFQRSLRLPTQRGGRTSEGKPRGYEVEASFCYWAWASAYNGEGMLHLIEPVFELR